MRTFRKKKGTKRKGGSPGTLMQLGSTRVGGLRKSRKRIKMRN